MSVLSILFAILAFLISPIGLACILAGLLTFFIIPLIAAVTDVKKPTGIMFWLASYPLRRAAILVSEANDIVFKQMRYDGGVGLHTITIDGDEKVFEDPDGALSHWLGIPFALANEEHGVLFDPRHAALGDRKHELSQRDETHYLATDTEYEHYGITKWVPGVFELPTRHELVDLSKVTELIDGGERSEYAKRVEELYKHSQDPFGDDTPITKFFYPIIAFGIVFFGIWIAAGQLGVPSGGGASEVVGFGSTIAPLLLIPSTLDDVKRVLRLLAGGLVFIILPLAVLVGIGVVFSPVYAAACAIAFTLGFTLVPVISMLSQVSATLAGAFSKLYFKLGFLGYHTPIYYWTRDGYELREYHTLPDDARSPTWYSLFGRRVGFTYPPSPDSWNEEVIPHADLENRELVTDGGDVETNLPRKYQRTNTMQRERYGAYIPDRVNDDSYYLHSGIALARFKNTAVGLKSLRRLLEAKEKFGGSTPALSDRAVLYLTAAGGLVGFLAGGFFFLL